MAGSESMNGRVCLVTGGNNGIGKETAVGLAGMGATVIIVSRNTGKGEAALADIKERSGNDSVTLMVADFASLAAVRGLAKDFQGRHKELHVLVNNAGGFNSARSETEDGYEVTFGVNHLAPFLLTQLLLDLLKSSAPSRVINVSAGAHSRASMNFDDLNAEEKYGGLSAYGQSKLANVLFTNELARRLEGTGVTANSLHPGVVKTGFGRNSGGVMSFGIKIAHAVGGVFFLSPEQGAETSVYLASSPDVASASGQYYAKKKAVPSNDESNDPAIAKRLWQVSEELVGKG